MAFALYKCPYCPFPESVVLYPAILEVTLEITVSGFTASGALIGNNCWLYQIRLIAYNTNRAFP